MNGGRHAGMIFDCSSFLQWKRTEKKNHWKLTENNMRKQEKREEREGRNLGEKGTRKMNISIHSQCLETQWSLRSKTTTRQQQPALIQNSNNSELFSCMH